MLELDQFQGGRSTSPDSRRKELPDSRSQSRVDAANDALIELEAVRKKHPDGLQSVEDWMKKWVPLAGYKRLGKILADKWK